MPDEYSRRTAITRLTVDDEQHRLLERTVSAWHHGCQLAVDAAWPQFPSQRHLQSRVYDRIRDQTGLGSQHAILATHQAADALAGCEPRAANGRAISKPDFTAPTPRYDARSMTLFDDDSVSLATTEGRVRCGLVLPEADDGYQYQYLDDSGWELTGACRARVQKGSDGRHSRLSLGPGDTPPAVLFGESVSALILASPKARASTGHRWTEAPPTATPTSPRDRPPDGPS